MFCETRILYWRMLAGLGTNDSFEGFIQMRMEMEMEMEMDLGPVQ